MYQAVTYTDGVSVVQDYLGSCEVQTGPDGLIFAPPQNAAQVDMPERLLNWLMDLRLLRNVPLAYLVPDAALLPPESIRFFHLDPTWVDRVVDGVMAAGNTGTVDAVFICTVLAAVRQNLDATLASIAHAKEASSTWTPAEGITGMLIRSELVRRWPDLMVQAWDDFDRQQPMPVLRAEPVSRDIYIALLAGQPRMVTVREPFNGVRFGVEPKPNADPDIYEVEAHTTTGATVPQGTGPKTLDIAYRSRPNRTLNFAALGGLSAGDGEDSPRQVAINLEQKPYLQEFKQGLDEVNGSREVTDNMPPVTFGKGRFSMSFDQLRVRRDQRKATGV